MSGGEKRILKINEDLFRFPDRKTKKKHDKDGPKIRLKPAITNAKNKTLRRSVLNLIRQKQKEEYDKLFSEKPDRNKKDPPPSTTDNFNKDFKESFEYLSSLVEKTKDEPNSKETHNNTFKRYPNNTPNSVLLQPDANLFISTNENISNELPPDFFENNAPVREPVSLRSHNLSNKTLPPPPKYGCLKNGSLPTYRNWYNKTQRNMSDINNTVAPQIPIPISSYQPPPLQNHSVLQQRSIINSPSIRDNVTSMEKEFLENQRKNEILQTYEKTTVGKKQNKVKYLKRKKIYKRTYRVGKSKIMPRVGVLVSNKTIRSRINTESQKLKLTPIHDVRKFLIKRGLIKVGSSAPDHILRKMYESMFLICGEVHNHNPENLLYNFINDTD